MSTLTETAKVEGDEAEEAEEDETQVESDEPAEQEPEPKPEPPASQMTEQEAEREFKRLESAAQTYLKKAMPITEKLGMPVQACPLCTFPGLAIPRGENEVTSDVEAAVLGMIGKSAELEFEEYEGFQQCPTCKGKGDVKTGAVIERSKHTTCPNPLCGGKGYITVPLPGGQTNGAAQYPGSEQTFTPLPQGIPDAWGRPAGHVHWGIDPANVGA